MLFNRVFKRFYSLSPYASVACLVTGCIYGDNKQYFSKVTPSSSVPAILESSTAELTVGAAGTNPPLDLFFIVDNSASMLGHQIDLGTAFANVFTANSGSLSKFNTNVYIFSTASTVNPSYFSNIPNRSPASMTSIPNPSDTANLALVPGSIFGIWNQAKGQYGVAPFSLQFKPAAVLNESGGMAYSSLSVARKGSQTEEEYQSRITELTRQFQNKLAYLNPTDQLSYESLTDASSGLCSVARILKHPEGLIHSGDSAAFIIVSDDNDRLNDRNPNNNQCIDSVVGSNQVVDGTCGHYKTNFSYNSSATLTYQNDTRFTYQSGTQLSYTYPSTESCRIQYRNGYRYSSTYTAIQTAVTYTKCTLTGDGTCLRTAPGTIVSVAGNYVANGGKCSQDMRTLVASPAPGTSFTCKANNLTNQTGPSGVDPNSNGSACSPSILAQISSQPNRTNITCGISAQSTTTATIANQPIGSCSSFCSGNSGSQYPACTLTQTTTNKGSGSLNFAKNGITCDSKCPDSNQCGNGTVAEYFTSLHANAVCGNPVPLVSTITVNAGANPDGTPLACNSNLNGFTVKDSSNQPICNGHSTVQGCIASLQPGTGASTCAVAGGSTTNIVAPVNVGCATSCSNSGGFCASSSGSVAEYLAQTKQGFCKASSNGGSQSLSLVFNTSIAGNASCSTPCSATLSGSCDGAGWGATNGATVADYLSFKKGANCSALTTKVADTASFAVDANQTISACKLPASPFFFASTSPHPASQVTNYVAGDSTHKTADIQDFIVRQANAVLGANNPSAFAVIGHLDNDDLYGTTPSSDYFKLAQAMGSRQISSITGNYSTALGEISNFIVESTQSSFSLPIPASDIVFTVSVLPQGSTTWSPIDSKLWSWAGGTLSINPSANIRVGDKLMYEYRAP